MLQCPLDQRDAVQGESWISNQAINRARQAACAHEVSFLDLIQGEEQFQVPLY